MAIENPLEMEASIGKSPINSVSSIAMFDYPRVYTSNGALNNITDVVEKKKIRAYGIPMGFLYDVYFFLWNYSGNQRGKGKIAWVKKMDVPSFSLFDTSIITGEIIDGSQGNLP